jgi:hypothetical protein
MGTRGKESPTGDVSVGGIGRYSGLISYGVNNRDMFHRGHHLMILSARNSSSDARIELNSPTTLAHNVVGMALGSGVTNVVSSNSKYQARPQLPPTSVDKISRSRLPSTKMRDSCPIYPSGSPLVFEGAVTRLLRKSLDFFWLRTGL